MGISAMGGSHGEISVNIGRERPSVLREPSFDRTTPNDLADALQLQSGRPASVLPLLMLSALYAIPAVVAMMPVLDLDIWWHLRTGEWVVQHGAVPTTDPFSRYGQGRPWVAYSWLFEVLAYGLYRGFGLLGILALRVTLALTIAWAIHRLVAKREPRFAYGVALVGAALFALVPVVSERPWLFTMLFFALTLDVVLDIRAGRFSKTAWFLPLIYVLWANIHIQFVYGLFVLALACAAPLADRFLGLGDPSGSGDTAGSRDWWKLVALSAACVLATLANPYHVRLYAVILELATQPAPYRLVVEHLAMGFRMPWNWAVLGLTGAAAFALGRRAKLSTFDVLLLVTTAYFSFHTQRDVWFVVLAAVGIIVTGRRRTGVGPDSFVLTPRGAFAVVALVTVALLATGRKCGSLTERGLEQKVAATFPAGAVAFVEQHGYPGPLYNDFNWGGYLIWRLRRLPVALDGRTNLHGDERLLRFNDTYLGQRGWDTDPDLKAARLVIWDAKAPLASLLRLHPDFDLVYEDAVAVVLIARPRAEAPVATEKPSPIQRGS